MVFMMNTTNTAAALETLRTQLAALQSKSEKCWALATDAATTEHERNAAAARSLALDAKAGTVAGRLHCAEKAAKATEKTLRLLEIDAEIYGDAGIAALVKSARGGDAAALRACEALYRRR